MSEGSDRTPITDGYVVPIAGLMALLFALMAGMTAPRLFSGSLADATLPIGFAVAAIVTLRIRQQYAAAKDNSAEENSDDETA